MMDEEKNMHDEEMMDEMPESEEEMKKRTMMDDMSDDDATMDDGDDEMVMNEMNEQRVYRNKGKQERYTVPVFLLKQLLRKGKEFKKGMFWSSPEQRT